jgi:hypothetical protein
MKSAPTEFHKTWVEQCAATENIRENFGLMNALDYLIGEKLFSFLHAPSAIPCSLPRCLPSSTKSGDCLQPGRSAMISITWNVRNISPLRSRTWSPNLRRILMKRSSIWKAR